MFSGMFIESEGFFSLSNLFHIIHCDIFLIQTPCNEKEFLIRVNLVLKKNHVKDFLIFFVLWFFQ